MNSLKNLTNGLLASDYRGFEQNPDMVLHARYTYIPFNRKGLMAQCNLNNVNIS